MVTEAMLEEDSVKLTIRFTTACMQTVQRKFLQKYNQQGPNPQPTARAALHPCRTGGLCRRARACGSLSPLNPLKTWLPVIQ